MTKQANQEPVSWQDSLYEVVHDLVYMLAAVAFLFVFFVRLVSVSGPSMTPTLLNGDKITLLSNVFYHEPKAGDVVVASVPSFEDGEAIVKRVIATSGQAVDIRYDASGIGTVYVDGEALTEGYINEPMVAPFYETISFPATVPEGCVFVMGDNRNHSADGRYVQIGMFDQRYVLGKVLFIVWPGQQDGGQKEFSRLGGVD